MANEGSTGFVEHQDDGGDHVQSPPEPKRLKIGKSHRKRKRHLFHAIVKQMEFYLGDANVSRSNFLKDKMAASPWIKLDVFLTFNKLVDMLREFFGRAETTDDLWKALKSIPSEVFEIREDETTKERQIKRKKPLHDAMQSAANEESRTIYVERLPLNVNIDMLKQLFEKHGDVLYVSLPRYKHNHAVKGFAFIEFKDEMGVKKALEAYLEAKRRMNTAMDPSELQSIKSYHIEQEEVSAAIPAVKDDKPEKSEQTLDRNLGVAGDGVVRRSFFVCACVSSSISSHRFRCFQQMLPP